MEVEVSPKEPDRYNNVLEQTVSVQQEDLQDQGRPTNNSEERKNGSEKPQESPALKKRKGQQGHYQEGGSSSSCTQPNPGDAE